MVIGSETKVFLRSFRASSVSYSQSFTVTSRDDFERMLKNSEAQAPNEVIRRYGKEPFAVLYRVDSISPGLSKLMATLDGFEDALDRHRWVYIRCIYMVAIASKFAMVGSEAHSSQGTFLQISTKP